jgi:hypothetical protein
MTRKSAAWLRNWHQRFWLTSNASLADRIKWHDQITSLNVSWHRVVVTTWLGYPVDNTVHVWPIVTWVRKNMAGTCMVLPRGTNSAHNGVQIWTTSVEDVTMLNLSGIGGRHRCFDPPTFSQHMSDALINWIKPTQ